MSGIIDMLSKPGADEAVQSAMTQAFEALKATGVAQDPRVLAAMDGLTPAQAIGLTREQLQVIYTLGYRKFLAGDYAAAQDVFTYLVGVDPLHTPNIYMAGMVLFAQGHHAVAADMFLMFLALDATNPVGYLRLGDCWLAGGERDRAVEAYKLAVAECANGHGDAQTTDEAKQRLAMATQEMKA